MNSISFKYTKYELSKLVKDELEKIIYLNKNFAR